MSVWHVLDLMLFRIFIHNWETNRIYTHSLLAVMANKDDKSGEGSLVV